MKKLILSVFVVLIGSQAFAKNETELAIDLLISKINQRITVENTELAKKGKKLYCNRLDARQVNLITNELIADPAINNGLPVYENLRNVNANDFAASVAEDLFCYPTFINKKDRVGIPGILNAVSYTKDLNLVKGALVEIKGSKIMMNDTLINVFAK